MKKIFLSVAINITAITLPVDADMICMKRSYHEDGILKYYHVQKSNLTTKWRCFTLTTTKYTGPYQRVLKPVTLLHVLIQVNHRLLRDPMEHNSEKSSDAAIPLIFTKSGK